MKLPCFVSALVLSLIMTQPAALATELTLSDALNNALTGNSELKKYPYRQRMAAAQSLQAALKPNPTLAFEVENMAGSGTTRGLSGAQATLSFNQRIELGDKREQRMAFASEAERQQAAEFEYAKVEVLAETASRFYRLLELQRLLDWNQQQQQRLSKTLTVAEERIDAGAMNPAEALRIRLEVGRAEVQQRELEGRVSEAKTRLAAMWSGSVEFAAAHGSLRIPLPLPSQADIEQAANQAPEFLRLIDEERLVNARYQATFADTTADITLGVGARYSNDVDDASLLFQVSIPLQLSNPSQGKLAADKAELLLLAEQQRLIREQIRSYGQALLIRMQTNHDYLESTQQTLLPLAQQLTEATLQGYQVGSQSLLQVLDAQQQLAQLEFEQIQRQSTIYQDAIELDRMTGQSFLGAAQ